MRILIIEDEPDMCSALTRGLSKCGYVVDFTHDGAEGLEMLTLMSYDLVLLDLNLPGMDGMDILRRLRQSDLETRVLIASARGDISERIAGLDGGANDFLVKPFDFGELLARIRGLLRRSFTQEKSVIEFSSLRFDSAARTVLTRDGEAVALSPKELAILECLLLRRGVPTTMEQLIERVWQEEDSLFSNSVKVHVSTLRKKLSAYCGSDIIVWIKNAGYMIREEQG